MATTLASLVVKIGADVTGVTAGMNTLEKRSRDLKKQFTEVKDSTLTWQGALGILAGATGLAFAAKKVFDLGAAVEETASKFSTVFGPAQDSVQVFIDDFASMAGLTDQAAKNLTATTGAIVQGMGFAQEASAELAMEVVRLSGDLSSFNNIPIEQTSKAIQSALTGERESLKSLGIVINEADVQQRAMAMSGKENAAALTQQEKAAATMALVTERAGVAVGDLERTQDSAANTARRVTAEIMNFRDGLSAAALPALNVFLQAIAESTGGLGDFSTRMQRMAPIIAAWANFAVKSFKTVATAIAAPIRIAFNLGEAFIGLSDVMYKLFTLDFKGAKEAGARLIGQFGDMKDAIGDVFRGFGEMRVASGEAWETMALGPPVARRVTTSLQDTTAATNNLTRATQALTVEVPEQRKALSGLTAELYTSQRATEVMKGVQDSLTAEFGESTAALETYRVLMGTARTAEDEFKTVQGQLNDLLKAGKINQDEYNAALAVAEQNMKNAKGSAGDLRGSLDNVLQGFRDLGIKIPESIESLVGDVDSKWGRIIAILQAPATLNALKTDWITFFNNLAGAVKSFWGAIKDVSDKVRGFFNDVGFGAQQFGNAGGLNINFAGAVPGGSGLSGIVQLPDAERGALLSTANATGFIASMQQAHVTLAASSRDQLVQINLGIASLVTMMSNRSASGPAGSSRPSDLPNGNGDWVTLESFNQEMNTVTQRTTQLRHGDMSV